MNDTQERAASGEDLRVDYASIEKTLSELWRVENNDDNAVTRAALWNVIAHASTPQHHAEASEVLSKAANAVPQRTIVVRADAGAAPEMSAWISANCHMLGEGKQVCSEEIAIVAGGSLVDRVPPLVNALLIPDMPVAFWWLGDLPHEQAGYVDALLEPADRLIVDSVNFDSPADLAIVERVSRKSGTAPADLNWIRTEEWRVAAASVFDPPEMRGRMRTLRRVRVVADVIDRDYFGQWLEPLFLAAWLISRSGVDAASIETLFEVRPADRLGVCRIDIEVDGTTATIERDAERRVITTNVDGRISVPEAVTRTSTRKLHDLIVRELKQPEMNRLLLDVLPLAIGLTSRLPR